MGLWRSAYNCNILYLQASNGMDYTHHLLLATPYLEDPNFYRSVVYITDYNQDGAIGFIMNRMLEPTMSSIISDFTPGNFPVYLGGPVANDTLHFVHSYGTEIPESKPLSSGLWWGGDFDFLRLRAAGKGLDTGLIRFFVGYSGWGEGQLEQEIREESWIVGPEFSSELLSVPPLQLWRKVLRSMGPQYAEIANSPDDPSLN
jgi:putative transcriptional regulator